MERNIGKAILAGLIGTVAMTIIMLMAPMMGLPDMRIGTMLSGFMAMPVAIGWIVHFVIGVFWAIVYAYTFAPSAGGGRGWLRGLLFSLIPWLLMDIIIFPMMGMGILAAATPNPGGWIMGSLIGHLVYGVVMGAVYGTVQVPQYRHAAQH